MEQKIIDDLQDAIDPIRASHSQRFFKTGPGDYGEDDKFLGVPVPPVRAASRKYKNISMKEVDELLHSEWHEMRLLAVFILVLKFQKAEEPEQKEVFEYYLENAEYVNNWDLVDSSAHKIVGPYLVNRPEKMEVLNRLAKSDVLWERRIAMISTLYNIAVHKSHEEAVELAHVLLHDEHDLMHKAVGWCLREIGKRVDEQILMQFLDEHAHEMPRVMLRYSIEKLPERTRQHYLNLK